MEKRLLEILFGVYQPWLAGKFTGKPAGRLPTKDYGSDCSRF